ncbi:MAG: alpha/beta hydrolase [Pseudomonadota bacterium]
MRPLLFAGWAFAIVFCMSGCGGPRASQEAPKPSTVSAGKEGLESTPCWIERRADWPQMDCYRMQVHEIPDDISSRLISFPVLRFRAQTTDHDNSTPVLHLGAGGPGAAMYLDSTDHVEWILGNHDDFSVGIGRDLVLIDPRGAGLSEPLLTCNRYVENVPMRWRQPMRGFDSWILGDDDFISCIREVRSKGISLAHYNSQTVARDIAKLSNALNVSRWVLFGVSYGSVYAQVIARDFPSLVESMIMDSATFIGLKGHHNYEQRLLGPFESLYQYCDYLATCDDSALAADAMEKTIWRVFVALNHQPLEVESNILGTVFVTGDRFIEILIHAVYGEDILRDLPAIVQELSNRESASLVYYLDSYLEYQLDRTYGDISFYSHHCYETKPFTDHLAIDVVVAGLEDAGLRAYAEQAENWPDYCGIMGIYFGDPIEEKSVTTEIPTLFLHGELDPITPLSEVEDQLDYFGNYQLFTFPLSHDVMNSDECAERLSKSFVKDPSRSARTGLCGL